MEKVNEQHKDRLFKFLFGNPENRAWTLSLYNAVNGSAYEDPEEIQFNTLENVVYMRMRNDVSFIVMSEMNLWEHQSTFNPNMPMRFFIYSARLYERYIAGSEYYPYSSTLQPVPRPRCVCFYNGMAEQPGRQVLRLSDAFGGEGDIEVNVTMLNVNYGKNKKLMEACQPLREYAWLVDAVRKYRQETQNLEAAVDQAIDEMPEEYVIRSFLAVNRAEVKNMFLTEYNEEKVLEQERKEGRNERSLEVATDMLQDGKPLEEIKKYSKLPESAIRKLAEAAGVVVE